MHEIEPRTSVRTSPLPKCAPGHTKTCSRFNLGLPESVLPPRHTKACSRFNLCLRQSVLPGAPKRAPDRTKTCSRFNLCLPQSVLSFQPLPTSKRTPRLQSVLSGTPKRAPVPTSAYLKASVIGNSNKELCKEPICHWKC